MIADTSPVLGLRSITVAGTVGFPMDGLLALTETTFMPTMMSSLLSDKSCVMHGG